jgi:hypothetical protein
MNNKEFPAIEKVLDILRIKFSIKNSDQILNYSIQDLLLNAVVVEFDKNQETSNESFVCVPTAESENKLQSNTSEPDQFPIGSIIPANHSIRSITDVQLITKESENSSCTQNTSCSYIAIRAREQLNELKSFNIKRNKYHCRSMETFCQLMNEINHTIQMIYNKYLINKYFKHFKKNYRQKFTIYFSIQSKMSRLKSDRRVFNTFFTHKMIKSCLQRFGKNRLATLFHNWILKKKNFIGWCNFLLNN